MCEVYNKPRHSSGTCSLSCPSHEVSDRLARAVRTRPFTEAFRTRGRRELKLQLITLVSEGNTLDKNPPTRERLRLRRTAHLTQGLAARILTTYPRENSSGKSSIRKRRPAEPPTFFPKAWHHASCPLRGVRDPQETT